MIKSRFHFSHFTSYLLYAFLILVTFSCFAFASFLNNEIANFLLSFLLAASLTGFIYFLIYKKERATRSFWLFFIFILSYGFSLVIIHIASLFNYVFWFALEYIVLSLFSFVWLIFKFITEIKEDKDEKDIYYTTTVFLPFVIGVAYLGLFMHLVIPKPVTQTDTLKDRSLLIFNKIYHEIDEQLQLEGYNVVKLSYIGFNEEDKTLTIGCFSTLDAYTYHLYEYSYPACQNANEVFEEIERTSHFPSCQKNLYGVDVAHKYVQTPPSIFDSYQVNEHYSVNYSALGKDMVSSIVSLKKDNKVTYGSFISSYSGDIVDEFYIYEGLGSYVVSLI